MKTTLVTNKKETFVYKNTMAVIGVSPFNSYFSTERIENLYSWVCRNFSQVRLYIPDLPTSFTLRALGYEPSKAEKKARRQCNYLKNKIKRALSQLDLNDDKVESLIIDQSYLDNNHSYLNYYQQLYRLFEKDKAFREGCLNSSKWVLCNQIDDKSNLTEDMLVMGAHYFMAELPMFLFAADILQHTPSVFCYHQCPEFLRDIYRGDYDDLLSKLDGYEQYYPEQGFLIVE
jgi:cyclo(L-tyrosyl-L-tyrosyl) synthase